MVQVRKALSACAVAVAAVAASVGFAAPAQAFYVLNHEAITRAALPADQVTEDAMFQILVGPPPGGGVVGSDAFATEEWRHLDNSANPFDICAKARTAWDVFSPVLLSGSVLTGGNLVDGPAARAAFGALLHTQQDFYSHTNWVEFAAATGDAYRIAPPIFPACNPMDFPPDLHTGFFNMDFSQEFPLEGCPPAGPPPPFTECHLNMAKDGPGDIRGGAPAPGLSATHYDVASQSATVATTNLYHQLRGLVAATNGEPAATMLFTTGGPEWIYPELQQVYRGVVGHVH
ncbi:hypothetical protein [Mycobacterium sp. C31M]